MVKDADWEKMRKQRGWPTPMHMHEAADALDALVIPKYGDVLRWVADACDAALEMTKDIDNDLKRETTMGQFEDKLAKGYAADIWYGAATAGDDTGGDPSDSYQESQHAKLEPDYEELARRKAAMDLETAMESLGVDRIMSKTQLAEELAALPVPEKKRIEQEAHDLVFGDRQAAYGHPSSDFTAMGRITAAILSRWLESAGYIVVKGKLNDPVRLPDIPPQTVALIMTAVKLSRQSAQPKRDNLVDLIGYVLCADRIVSGEPDGK